jgi:hypothetical protein
MKQVFAAHLNRNVVIGGCKLVYSHPKGVSRPAPPFRRACRSSA